jgi:heat shock protein HslJ
MKTMTFILCIAFISTSLEVPEFGTISFPDGYRYHENKWDYDTTSIDSSNGVPGKWIITHFYFVPNDNLSRLFSDSIVTYELKFDTQGHISGSDGCYGFGGQYAICRNHRILVIGSGSTAIQCVKAKLNMEYQSFNRIIVNLINESRYEVRQDTLLLKNSLGFIRLTRLF